MGSEEEERKKKEFLELGGRGTLIKISKIFYDKVYEDPWIGEYFKHVPQERIESQQVDFMTAALGGGKVYFGRMPIPAHQHMFIDEELFALRQKYLKEAFTEANAKPALIEKWLKIDESFKPRLLKEKISDCEKRFTTDEILFFKKPPGYKG